ncbi:hypothetical protein [Candidatus Albibeggiatoa sp. nov. NOAA]|uniref:hypothetical protein n=1 Tax=Candidatus Albibeggiatoa sp. nov. NOAA TaxID=3162724 RepID=UPI0032FFE88D|nr:hypothetical protein [Thiotrichaceae bacterium]
MKRLFTIVCLSFIVASCSNQSVYESVKANRINECRKLPQAAYEECMARYSQSYDEYEAERQDLLKN